MTTRDEQRKAKQVERTAAKRERDAIDNIAGSDVIDSCLVHALKRIIAERFDGDIERAAKGDPIMCDLMRFTLLALRDRKYDVQSLTQRARVIRRLGDSSYDHLLRRQSP